MKVGLFILFSLITFNAVAQQSKEDSLLQVLRTTKVDSAKLKAMTALGNLYGKNDPSASLPYLKDGLKWADEKSLGKMTPEIYLSLGTAYQQLGKNDSALLYLDDGYKAAVKYNNSILQIQTLNLAGFVYKTIANFKDAAEKMFAALKIAEAAKDSGMCGNVYNSISALYYDQADYDKALLYGEKALAILKKRPNQLALGGSYLNVGLIYADSKNEKKAEEYYILALEALKKTPRGQLHIATVYGNLSLLSSKDINEKIGYLQKAQKIWDAAAPDHPNAVGNLGNLGTMYLSAIEDSNFTRLVAGEGVVKNKAFLLNKAEELLKIAYDKCKAMQFDKDLQYFTSKLAEVEEAKDNYKLANQYLRESIVLSDSIYSQDNKNKIAKIEGEREVLIRDKEIQLNKLAISNQKKVRIGLIAGLLLLTVIGGMLYRQSRTRKKNNTKLLMLNNELDEANKVKARFFGIISHDLRSPVASLVTFLNLQQEEPGMFSAEQAAAHRLAIKTSAESLLETMEAMLQWSKSQMNNFKPQEKIIPVQELFQQIRMNFNDTPTLAITVQDPVSLKVSTDPDYLRTILHNLTANAVNALQLEQNGKIEWKAYQADGKIILSVTDNGPGATGQQMDALYNKEAAVNSKNGLGLHLIRDLAAAINCVISFESKPGAGTTFRLSLAQV